MDYHTDTRFHRKKWRRKTSLLSDKLIKPYYSSWSLLLFLSWACVYSCLLDGVNGAMPTFPEFHFQTEPSSLTVAPNQSAMMQCDVAYSGKVRPSIAWVKVGDAVKLEDTPTRQIFLNGSLYFKSVSDPGDYRCKATLKDPGTIVSRRASLQVAGLSKKFQAEPKSVQLPAGAIAAFECIIEGQPQPKITWYKVSSVLQPSDKVKIFPSGVLEIGPLSDGDFTFYTCRASVPEQYKDSRQARISRISSSDTSLRGPPKFLLKPRVQRATKGSTVYLHCVAISIDPQGLDITWHKDGKRLTFNNKKSHFLQSPSGTLVINGVVESDAGLYTCRATNAMDSVDADAALTVLVPPEFKVKPVNKFAHVGSDVIFNCQAYGMPQPNIVWLKDGDVLTASNYFKLLHNSSLQIRGVVSSDEGVYQCVAQNELEDIQAIAQLAVLAEGSSPLGSPELATGSIQKVLKPVNLQAVVIRRNFVTLTWSVADGKISEVKSFFVYWQEVGSERKRMGNTTLAEYTIQGLKPQTKYGIWVRAYSNQGPSQEEAKITITTDKALVSTAPADLQVMTLSSKSIKVTWRPPLDPRGTIDYYMLHYYQVGSPREKGIKVKSTSYLLKNLESHKKYTFRVVAFNENGEGMSTNEMTTRTYSDKPGDVPQNFTLEVSSSNNLIVRWQPPPHKARNGVIKGYKIRFRKKGAKHGQTKVADGNRNTYVLTDLRKDTEYQVRVSATTVNGTGPATPWMSARTYKDDLDESTVPPMPAHLSVIPKANSIQVLWAPPLPNKILVQGYVLGYGKGIADVYKVALDANTHEYNLKDLQSSSVYVITIRAYNGKGQGPPKYETVSTSDEYYDVPYTKMKTPMQLKAQVISSSTVILTWHDRSAGENDGIDGFRYYTVKYGLVSGRIKKAKSVNTTAMNCHIERLRPNTEYDFKVMVTKGHRSSEFSMSVRNKTEEAAPSSPPRDVTPVQLENNPMAVSLNWQPPAKSNGQITGYHIYYTNDLHSGDINWPSEGVQGDVLSTVIDNLTPATTYHFIVQAKNKKGTSPKSEAVTYLTPEVADSTTENAEDEEGLTSNVLIIIGVCIAAFIFCSIVIAVIVYLCRRRENQGSIQNKPIQKGGKLPPSNVKPPDLWIHDPNHLELQKMDRSQRSESSVSVATSTLRRGSRGSAEHTDDQASTLDRRRNSFVGESGYPSSGEERYQPIQPRNLIRPKPITLPGEQGMGNMSPGMPNGQMVYGDIPNVSIPMRPIYPRTQYNTQYSSTPARVNAGDIPHSCAPSKALSSVSEDDRDSAGHESGMEDSFSARIGYVKPQQNLSPYKKPTPPTMPTPNKGQRTPVAFNSKSPELNKTKKDEPADMSKSLSTEELTAEMANLEGLMKDLNAITQQEFEC